MKLVHASVGVRPSSSPNTRASRRRRDGIESSTEALEGRWRRGHDDLRSRTKRRGIQGEGQTIIQKISGTRQIEFYVSLTQHTENLFVTNVFAGFNVAQREPKGQSPGEQRLALANTENRASVPFEDRMPKNKN